MGDIVQQALYVAVLASTADGVLDCCHNLGQVKVVDLGQLALLIVCAHGHERARDTLLVFVQFSDLGQVPGAGLTLNLLLKLPL